MTGSDWIIFAVLVAFAATSYLVLSVPDTEKE